MRLIARRWGWEDEVERALLAAGVPALKYLESLALTRLLAHLRALEDCLYTAGDPPDTPPAR